MHRSGNGSRQSTKNVVDQWVQRLKPWTNLETLVDYVLVTRGCRVSTGVRKSLPQAVTNLVGVGVAGFGYAVGKAG